MRSIIRRLAIVVLPALVLGACSGEIMQTRYLRSASNSFFQYGAGRGDMLAVVIGNPFPLPKEAVDRAVTDAMYRNHYGPVTRFSTDPGPAADRNLRVVLAFNPPAGLDNDRLCDDPAAVTPGATGERLRAVVGFCVEKALYTVTDISIPAVESPKDPRFRHMIASAMWDLVPSWDPLSQGENVCIGADC